MRCSNVNWVPKYSCKKWPFDGQHILAKRDFITTYSTVNHKEAETVRPEYDLEGWAYMHAASAVIDWPQRLEAPLVQSPTTVKPPSTVQGAIHPCMRNCYFI